MPHKNLSGKFVKIRAKMLRKPKNLPVPTPMLSPFPCSLASLIFKTIEMEGKWKFKWSCSEKYWFSLFPCESDV